jgi:hypothetical protein
LKFAGNTIPVSFSRKKCTVGHRLGICRNKNGKFAFDSNLTFSLKMTNPLLSDFTTPFATAPFHLIKPEHFLPAVKGAITEAKQEIENIKSQPLPSFENTIEALDRGGKRLGIISAIFFNLNSAETNDEIQKLAREISPLHRYSLQKTASISLPNKAPYWKKPISRLSEMEPNWIPRMPKP